MNLLTRILIVILLLRIMKLENELENYKTNMKIAKFFRDMED